MATVQSFAKGTPIRTRPRLDKNTNRSLNVYDDTFALLNTKAIDYPAAGGLAVGTYEYTVSNARGTFWYIKLKTPLVVNGKTYTYAFLSRDALFAYVPTLTDYWVKTNGSSLRVRDKASTTTGKALKSLANKTFAGRSDGTESNGFLYLTLADGTTKGWASKLYLTATKPAAAPEPPARKPTDPPKPPTTGTATNVVVPPTDPPVTQKITIALENTVGTKNVKWVLYAAGGLLAIGLGLIVWKLVQNAKKKKK